MAESSYSGKDIEVLEGLDPVRKRPGMYIGGTDARGLHHLLWEIVDNSVDEAVNGYARTITVTLHRDRSSVTVADDGRGIPVDIHPQKGVPALEVILTTLHAGGKFGGGGYVTSGGLHGVGASVVNALSTELIARVKRDGRKYRMTFSRGVSTEGLVDEGPGRGTGTETFFRPDPDIFPSVEFSSDRIREQLEVKAYLNAGLELVFVDEAAGKTETFAFDEGIMAMLQHRIARDGHRPVHGEPFIVRQDTLVDGYRIEVVLQWTEAPKESVLTFVNGIPTRDGGTHEQGLREAVRSAVRAYMDTHDMLPKKLEVSADDVREGLVGIVNLFMVDPQFQGQTKDRLNNTEARPRVVQATRLELEQWLNAHPTTGEAIAQRVIQAARARLASRAAVQQVRTRTAGGKKLNLPGKLADCSASDPTERELFIVEGDSAGGSAKQGRDRTFQAVLPLRGKVLNAEQATAAKVRANKELDMVIKALGCGLGDEMDLSKLRYHRIILLMDADSDGHHIATLLLTFFYRYMRPLIDAGHVYLAQPPLYRIDHAKETWWALDDGDRDRIIRQIEAKRRNAQIETQRFKGLGEMMPKTLKETTLDPETRRLLQIVIEPDEARETEDTISRLMGKDASERYRFIMDHADEVDDIDV